MRPTLMIFVALVSLWALPVGAEPAVVAVFDLEVTGLRLDRGTQESLSEVLFSKVAALPGFTVIPRSDLKTRLSAQKKESYRECYDQSCQIEIGKELAAGKLLSTKILKLGSECTVSTVLYDLRTAATEAAADATGSCKPSALAKTVGVAITSLGGKTTAAPAAAAPTAMTMGVPDEKYCPIAGTRRMGEPWPDGQSVSCLDAQGKLQGTMIAWAPSGKISMKSEFKDSQMEGRQTLFHANGAIFQQGDNQQGRHVGVWISYYDDGTKMEEGRYERGAKVGKWLHYRPDGKKDQEAEYAADQQEGPMVAFHADGVTPRETAGYRGGKLEGLQTTFRPDGSKDEEQGYQGGLRHGVYKRYAVDRGQLYLAEEGAYERNQRSGRWRTFTKEGDLDTELHYQDGQRHGPSEEWERGSDGQRYRAKVGKYVAGKREGVWTTYRADGSIAKEETYEDDRPRR